MKTFAQLQELNCHQQTHDIFLVPSGLGTSTSKEAKAFCLDVFRMSC